MAERLPLIRISTAAIALLLTASCATVPQETGPDPKLAEALKGMHPGKPRSCIPLDEARSAKVYRGAILYTPGRRMSYVNTSPGCYTNDYDPLFVVEAFGTQLCKGDTVKFVDRLSGMQGGFCVLGEFTPYHAKR
ncbi:MAG: hypothetical protein V4530_02610 [Pseudomonadota bacterium]